MSETRYEYDNFKVDLPSVDDGWYLVKNGMTYRVEVPIDKMRFTKSINILTGEVYYPSNADRIRSMSDEELAAFLTDIEVKANNYGYEAADGAPDEYPLPEDWLAWLKQEVDA